MKMMAEKQIRYSTTELQAKNGENGNMSFIAKMSWCEMMMAVRIQKAF